MQVADKPVRPHRRYPGGGAPGAAARQKTGAPPPVTGKRSPALGYDPSMGTHSESMLRRFYDFHLEAGTGPKVNPLPMSRCDIGVQKCRPLNKQTTQCRPPVLPPGGVGTGAAIAELCTIDEGGGT
jgi:hypothetical protein